MPKLNAKEYPSLESINGLRLKEMPIANWSKLNKLQLGRYVKYYTKMEFASYGFEVYTSDVDDHGIDFIVKRKNGSFLELQVKAICQSNYVYMQKEKWNINDPGTYLIIGLNRLSSRI